MKRIFLTLIVLIMALPMVAQSTLKVGAAKVDITPTKDQLANKTDIIHGKLYVRAIYVSDGTHAAILASADQGGLHNFDDCLKEVASAVGCPVENVLITATHTHSGNTHGFSGHPSVEKVQQAFLQAAKEAKAKAVPARMGFGQTQLDLNVNRDLWDENLDWSQGPNFDGASDKTLSVITFLGEDDVPVAVYMNYAMHPVNYFLRGVVSADYPGVAAAYVEDLFDGKTVALFSQGTAGDQNPVLAYSSIFEEGDVKGVLPDKSAIAGKNPETPGEIPAERMAAHQKTVNNVTNYVTMLGTMMGVSTVKTMLYNTIYEENPRIWAAEELLTLPGRTRIDTTGRENYNPGYTDGPDVHFSVGLIRIGSVNMVTVSGEVYTEIGQHLQKVSPCKNTFMVTLRPGMSPGYIYSNKASNNLSFQVIGSALQPGHAEKGIVDTAVKLMKQANK